MSRENAETLAFTFMRRNKKYNNNNYLSLVNTKLDKEEEEKRGEGKEVDIIGGTM